MKVCVVGLGTIGAPVVEYVYKHDFEVCGYDLVEKEIENIQTFTVWEKVPNSDIYIVAVPSNNVENACQKISKKSKDSLVSVESTVQVGTCRKISEMFDLRFLVHCPHRYWVKKPIDYGVKQPRVIGAINKESLERALKFYRRLEIPLHVCSSIEIAEICKVAENAYRFVQIAFAEELRMICVQRGIPFDEVRNACNTKWNVKMLEAREGIIGTCLSKDIRYLKLLTNQSPLIDGAILTDEIYRKLEAKKNARGKTNSCGILEIFEKLCRHDGK